MGKNKILAYIFAFLLILSIFSQGFAFAYAKNDKKDSMRVISFSENDSKKAIENGCVSIKKNDKLEVFNCSRGIAKKIGLKEDIILTLTDVNVNQKIDANSVFGMDVIYNETKEVNTGISIYNYTQIKLNVKGPVETGAKYTLYSTNDIASGQWKFVESIIASNSDPLYFIQPITDKSTFFKIVSESIKNVPNTGKGRVVVVLDTGYDYNNPELSSSYMGGYDFVNEDGDPMDDNGHGTKVAGIITADGIVDPNVKGVAPDVGIVSGKVGDASGNIYVSDTISAIYWAVDNYNPDAISMSIGSGALYTGYCDEIFFEYTQAIRYANQKGVSVVIGSGNFPSGVSFPGCISDAFTVGATDFSDRLATFSGRGMAVDVAAPGVGIYTTGLNSSYVTVDGTSISTPIVSGVIALMKAQNPNADYISIQNGIKSTGVRIKGESYKRIDAYNAMTSI